MGDDFENQVLYWKLSDLAAKFRYHIDDMVLLSDSKNVQSAFFVCMRFDDIKFKLHWKIFSLFGQNIFLTCQFRFDEDF